jgi:group I intron endonuclease
MAQLLRDNNVSGIYQIKNLVNGSVYIGSSVDIAKRFKTHKWSLKNKRHHNRHLQSAWNYYGSQNFIFEELKLVGVEELISEEQKYIDSVSPEYNLSPTAGNTLGYRHTDESRKSMSRSHMGKTLTPETKAKMSAATSGELNPMYDKKHSDMTRRKMSESSKGISRNAGTNNPNSKLNPSTVKEIRSKYIKGIYGYIRLAKEYGVSAGCIEGVITRRRWNNV